MIEFKNINKSYRVAKRQAGFGNAVKSLFSKKYETIHALSDVGFNVKEGEMVGYIGPNGAGKSTTIKIMCGVLTPDSGICKINGRTPWKDRVRHVKDIGVVFGQRSQLWWDVPVIDSFTLLRDMYKVDNTIYNRNVEELSHLLNLEGLLETPVRNLSLGQRMRCEIAASLIHNPKILFLDEPTIGLDAVSKIAVRDFIKEQNRRYGTTVILTTHDMQDIEVITNRVLLIGKGKILLDGKLEDLKKQVENKRNLLIEYSGDMPLMKEGMSLGKRGEGKAQITFDPSILRASDAIAYIASNVDLIDVSVSDISAEEVVAALYKEYKI